MNQNARRLLIIEDDPIIANIYRSKFEKEGYEVEIAPDGQAGFYRLHEAHFDALLLDLMLPQMNGLDILKKLRAQKRFEKFPIIVFTNAYLGNIAHEASQAGATQIFFKANTTPKQIIDTLNGILYLPSASPGTAPAAAPPSVLGTPGAMPAPPAAYPSNPPPTAPAPSPAPSWFSAGYPPGTAQSAPPPSPSSYPAQPAYPSAPPVSPAYSGRAPYGYPGVSGIPATSAQPAYPFPQPTPQAPNQTPAVAYPPAQTPAPMPMYEVAPAYPTTPVQPRPPISPAGGAGSFPTAPSPVPSSREADAAFQAEILQAFLGTAPETVNALRKLLQALIQGEGEAVRVPQILELSRKIHSLTSNAALSGLNAIPQIGTAFEALLRELHAAPSNLNASTIHTIAQTIDFLGVLLQRGTSADSMENRPINILVVDDEMISRRAVTYALEKANLKSISVEDPLMAYRLLENNSFDLVVTDVDMPGMTGFELCTKLRALPNNRNTPVIFVTGLTDFESRARSVLSGGNDLIAKPFMLIELAVKALTFVIRGRIS